MIERHVHVGAHVRVTVLVHGEGGRGMLEEEKEDPDFAVCETGSDGGENFRGDEVGPAEGGREGRALVG